MRQLGNDISFSLTLPIAGIGIAALQAAGEMESLRLAMQSTFESAGRSIEQANGHMEDLRKAALAPGLDFPQAVKASIRLQGVGANAEDALKTIKQLANAISLTGGTAANLESVTVQMAQMISKGKVLAQDLRIIQENMPIVSRLMQQAFGTSNSEALQELGITGAEFVAKITAEMEKLPRVSGGITNAIVNFGSAMRQALATVGDSINKTFSVSSRLDQFSGWIMSLADEFAGLSEGTKAAVLGTLTFVAAIGPAIRVVGLMGGAVMGVQNAFTSLQIAFNAIKVTGIIGWWQSLNTVMRANVIGITVSAALALAAAFSLLSKDTSAAAQASMAIEDVSKTASSAIADEKVKVDLLIATLKEENKSRQEKKAALDQLKQISPQYFGQLNAEKINVDALTRSYDLYIASLLRSAKAAAAREKLVEIEKQLLDIDQRRGKFSSSEKTALGFAGITANSTAALQKQKKVLDEMASPLIAQRDALANVVAENENLSSATVTSTTNLDKHTKKVKEAEIEYDGTIGRVKQLVSVYANLAKAIYIKPLPSAGNTQFAEIGKKTETGVDLAPVESLEAADEKLKSISTALALAKASADSWNKSLVSLSQSIQVTTSGPLAEMNSAILQISQNSSDIGKIALGAFVGLAEAAASGKASFAELGKAALAGAADVAKALIVEIALRQALKAIEKGSIFGALAAIGIAAASVGALTAIVASVKTPKLAQGGIAYGPTSAIVGEYPGARANPEVIAPLSKLKAIIGAGRAENQHVTVGGAVRWSGTEFVIGFEQAQKQLRRTRGY